MHIKMELFCAAGNYGYDATTLVVFNSDQVGLSVMIVIVEIQNGKFIGAGISRGNLLEVELSGPNLIGRFPK